MTKLSIYTIITVRCILLFIGFLIAVPVWLIHVFSLCINTVSSAYLSSLLSFVSSTRELNTRLDKQLNETNK